MMCPHCFATDIVDLATLAEMLVDRAHDNLSHAIDCNGRLAVAISPTVAAEMHMLIRDIARRAHKLGGAYE